MPLGKCPMCWVGIFAAGLCLLASPARAENSPPPKIDVYPGVSPSYSLGPRNALVIGVSTYRETASFSNLSNPIHDADEVYRVLTNAHFLVNELTDERPPAGGDWMTDRQSIKTAVYTLAETLRSRGGVGLVYFSGHALLHNGQIYLVPHDALFRYERDFYEELIPLQLFYDAFTYAGNPLNFLIVDACRDDPLPKPLENMGQLPNYPNVDAPNVIVAFSTMNGKKAGDAASAEAEMGPYASAFVKSIQPDIEQTGFFENITKYILNILAQLPPGQLPKNYGMQGPEFVFYPTVKSFNREGRIFQTALSNKDRALMQALKLHYGGGYFYKAAAEQLDHWPVDPPPLPPLSDSSGTSPLSPNSASGPAAWLRPASVSRTSHESDEEQLARMAAPKPQDFDWTSRKIDLGFVADQEPGVERLSEQSQREIEKLKRDRPTTKVSVIGYRYSGPREQAAEPLRLLMRQADVVQALGAAGFPASSMQLSSSDTDKMSDDDKVSLEVSERRAMGSPAQRFRCSACDTPARSSRF